MVERFLAQRRTAWARPLVVAVLLLGGCVTAPFALPILPPDTLIAYQRALGLRGPQEEVGHGAALDQHFADRFGWPELAAAVANVYNGLPTEERAQCAIIASNYGEAAAVDWFGRAYGLPPAVSTHNNYWIWGPGNATGDVVIWIGHGFKDLIPLFEEGAEAARSEVPLAEESSIPIWLFRRAKPGLSIQQIWPKEKHFI
jgi:hypothetical protein